MAKTKTDNREFFPSVNKIQFEGRESDNPLSFRFYDPGKKVSGKTMKDHLRFAVAYWHTLGGTGVDPFGPGTKKFPWTKSSNVLQSAKDKMDAAFELIGKLDIPYYCFHDFDLIAEGSTLSESEKNLYAIVGYAKQKQKEKGIKLLWGTANLFSNPRYMNGAATNPDFSVVAYAGAQVAAPIPYRALIQR